MVWNVPSLVELPELLERRTRDGLQIHFHGSVNPFALPLQLIDAMARVPEVRLRIVGYAFEHANVLPALRERADRLGVSERLEILAAVPRPVALAMAAQADLGIAFYRPHPNNINATHTLGAANKVFDYLAAGIGVLVSEAAEWHGTIVPAYGRCCDPDSAESIVEALRAFSTRAPDPLALGFQGRARIEAEWHHERAFAPVIEVVAQ